MKTELESLGHVTPRTLSNCQHCIDSRRKKF